MNIRRDAVRAVRKKKSADKQTEDETKRQKDRMYRDMLNYFKGLPVGEYSIDILIKDMDRYCRISIIPHESGYNYCDNNTSEIKMYQSNNTYDFGTNLTSLDIGEMKQVYAMREWILYRIGEKYGGGG